MLCLVTVIGLFESELRDIRYNLLEDLFVSNPWVYNCNSVNGNHRRPIEKLRLPLCDLQEFCAGSQLEKGLKTLEAIGVKRDTVVFAQPNPELCHVNSWKQVVVERRLVGAVHSQCDRDVRAKTQVKTNMPTERSGRRFPCNGQWLLRQ